MSIYIRGDANPFILTGKSDKEGTALFGYWSDEFKPGSERASHQTDRSRIVADGAAAEVEQVVSGLPIVTRAEAMRKPAVSEQGVGG